MSSEGSDMSTGGRLILNQESIVIELGDEVGIMFTKPTAIDRDQVDVLLLGTEERLMVSVNSKTLMGALRALEVGHDVRKVHEEGREKWQVSM